MIRRRFRTRLHRFCASAAMLAALTWSAGVEGYEIRGNEVVIESGSDWQRWQIPTHLVRLEQEGAVRSKNFRTLYNVLSDTDFRREVAIDKALPRVMNVDSTQRLDVFGKPSLTVTGAFAYDYFYRPGISRVGSNPAAAANILDDDPTTFWQPDPNDPLDQWWIEIDMGRAVPLERFRMQFVDEELGDPFLRFILLIEPRQAPLLEDEQGLDFATLVPFKGLNEDQRVFTIDAQHTSSGLLPPAEGLLERQFTESRGDPDSWTGRLIQVIRIQITETRGARKEQISQQAWNDLPLSERGDVAYFVRDVAGRQEPVDEATWLGLDPERQGRRDFYRRELPRLAEVDAWGWGDNVALGMIDGGGSTTNTLGVSQVENAFDGDLSTFYKHTYFDESLPLERLVVTDLGGTVWLSQARMISLGYHQAPHPRGYILRASSGVRDAEGRIKFEQISAAAHERNVEVGDYKYLTEALVPAQRVRFLEFLTLKNLPEGSTTQLYRPGIGEIMIFSEGPPAEAVLESGVITLPGQVDLGAIRWEADTPPGTRVEIRTRTGDQLRRRIRYFDSGGGLKSEKDWLKLLSFLRGPSDTTFVAGAGWSSWSQRYEDSGERARSPALRRYMQIQARLIADRGASPPALERITVGFHDPAVRELAAEIWPRQIPVGVLDTFEVFVRPLLVESPASQVSPGFDELMLRSQPPLDMEVLEVALGAEAEFAANEPFRVYDRRAGEALESVDGEAVELVHGRGDSLYLRFPAVVETAPEALAPRSYFRALDVGDEVPTRTDGTLMNAGAYEDLPEEQKGTIRYFSADGESIPIAEWEALPEQDRGPVRYFRIVTDVGDQSVFDASGDTLTAAGYQGLSASARGPVVGSGRLVRLKLAAAVFLNGTELNVAARRGSDVPWQAGEARDVTDLTPGRGLTLSAAGAQDVVRDLTVVPNPFTPNGDGINDVTRIGLSLFRVFEPRPLTLRVYTLSGRPVRTLEQMAVGGRREFEWDGTDEKGGLVPPGLYLVQVEADSDAGGSGRTLTRVVNLAY